MKETRPAVVLSMRVPPEFLDAIEEFRSQQVAIPSQTAAVIGLVKLGLDAWKKKTK